VLSFSEQKKMVDALVIVTERLCLVLADVCESVRCSVSVCIRGECPPDGVAELVEVRSCYWIQISKNVLRFGETCAVY